MRLRYVGTSLAIALLSVPVLVGVTAAASPALYKGPAQRLMPSAVDAGFEEITSQAGGGSRASASYRGSQPGQGTGKVAVRVFKSEAAAKTSYAAACQGCQARSSGSWKYKRRIEPAPDPRTKTVTLVARCRNLRVDTTKTAVGTDESLTKQSRLVIDDIFVKARSLGMSPCSGTGQPPPATGTYYWSESYAEEVVVKKVRIPYCNVFPDDPQCRVQSPFPVVDAQCRGLDEKPGTFTYSRFTCDIRVGYYGRISGRIAVWPTGPTTLRWEII
jgi:hypothetical protein